MALLYQSDIGFFISHQELIQKLYENVYNSITDEYSSYKLKEHLFSINSPYKPHGKKQRKQKRKIVDVEESNEKFEELNKTVEFIKNQYDIFLNDLLQQNLIKPETSKSNNDDALVTAETLYTTIKKYALSNSHGANTENTIITKISTQQYLFPSGCNFYCKNTSEIETCLNNQKFDLILLDPPWWNKYIRRKKSKCDNAYEMMYNSDLKEIPIEQLLEDNGLVVVWCTNSQQHLDDLTVEIFSKWNVSFLGKWFWLKITKHGEPVCNFSEPPGKQPFEQIIFGCRNMETFKDLPTNKIVVSIPSALHSHKPPLVDLLKSYIPENPKCLEIFARYLLPGWTSFGLEAMLLQHESLYENVNKV